MTELVPLVIVTGFLGSGKTTLLQRYLATPSGARTGVVVNEFGEVGLDHRLLVHSREQIELIDGGCMCCARRSDIGRALHELVRRAKSGKGQMVDRIIIETTGLADPSPIVSSIGRDAWMKANIRLEQTICVLDSVNGQANAAIYPEARRQIAIADAIVITKQDLRNAQTPADISAFVRGITPDAMIVDSQSPAFDMAAIVERDVRSSVAPPRSTFLAEDSSHRSAWTSFTIPIPSRLDWPVFTLWLSSLLYSHGNNILRVKGLIRTTSSDGPLIVHGVQHVMHPPTHLRADEDASQQGFLVFITDGLERSAIEESMYRFQSYASPAELVGALP